MTSGVSVRIIRQRSGDHFADALLLGDRREQSRSRAPLGVVQRPFHQTLSLQKKLLLALLLLPSKKILQCGVDDLLRIVIIADDPRVGEGNLQQRCVRRSC